MQPVESAAITPRRAALAARLASPSVPRVARTSLPSSRLETPFVGEWVPASRRTRPDAPPVSSNKDKLLWSTLVTKERSRVSLAGTRIDAARVLATKEGSCSWLVVSTRKGEDGGGELTDLLDSSSNPRPPHASVAALPRLGTGSPASMPGSRVSPGIQNILATLGRVVTRRRRSLPRPLSFPCPVRLCRASLGALLALHVGSGRR